MADAVRIVSDPDIQGGRYCYAGTRIPVGAIVAYVRSCDRETTVREWGHGLTLQMVDAALAFGWPAQREAEATAMDLGVRCVCGEWISADRGVEGDKPVAVACVCGRKWVVEIKVRAAE